MNTFDYCCAAMSRTEWYDLPMKTVVMTGATAGLGEVAARQISKSPNTRLLIGARGSRALNGITVLPLDLARLADVRAFAEVVLETLRDAGINALVLNAGAQFPNLDQRTEDGFETTFAVNHLAHYLLLRLLLPKLAEHARVIITTSDTHDPKTNPIAPPLHADAELLAHPDREPKQRFLAGFRAYSASKLCNLLTARALAASPAAQSHQFCVVAYNPGFTPGTSLQRAWPLPVRVLMSVIGFMRPVLRLNTAVQAGSILAELALGEISPPNRRIYASLVKRRLTWPEPSDLARRDDLVTALWSDSARMVGLPA
jgi:NAD(P)-dependent dehydrogenase (short-subunit alcohol dehydrogenase family)